MSEHLSRTFLFPVRIIDLRVCPVSRAAEIGIFEGFIVVYRFIADLHFYVTGGEDENELILSTVLTAFFEAVSHLLRGNVEKKTVLENLDLVLLCLDELVDGG
ncbi:unnamed protein product [Closterium sp. NIES-64]|nr:unnamed protein product [Closterium sp. NIES-64]